MAENLCFRRFNLAPLKSHEVELKDGNKASAYEFLQMRLIEIKVRINYAVQ